MHALDFVKKTCPPWDDYLAHIGRYADGSARSKVANAVRDAHQYDDDVVAASIDHHHSPGTKSAGVFFSYAVDLSLYFRRMYATVSVAQMEDMSR